MTDKPTHTTPTTAFSGGLESVEDIIFRFAITPDALTGAHIIAAHYEVGDWEGSAFVLFEKDGNLYEVQGSHCSCYGLEGQWAPEIGTPESLIHRAKACNGGYPMYQAAEKVLAYLTVPETSDDPYAALSQHLHGEGDWPGPGEKPHQYSPDPMMMGDCAVCGHTAAAHTKGDNT